MTREEAIRQIGDSKVYCEEFADGEAFDMAIEALKQMNALDKIRAEIKEHADRLKDSLYGDGIRHCIDIIDKYRKEN